VQFSYAQQPSPDGLAQAFIIGKEFIGKDPVALALGDNIFYGHGFADQLKEAASHTSGATVFGYRVKDPERYGVVEFDSSGMAIDIVEKPTHPRSPYAVTGIYFYDNSVVEIARELKPSPRGELEITDVNLAYLRRKSLRVERLGRGVAWLDTGTHESLLHACNFIQTLQERQGLMVACLEEIAFLKGFISRDQLDRLADANRKSAYGQYLKRLVAES
jgi:glucose-1-phosphate thymidylyltransferase